MGITFQYRVYGNELIAKFMELPLVDCKISSSIEGIITKGYLHPSYDSPFSASGLQYDCKWDDWLMSVVEKIESITDNTNCCLYNVQIEQCFCTIISQKTSDTIVEIDGDTKFEAVYKAIVGFLEIYYELTTIY